MPKKIDPNNIPKHIAIIMDGNGRWAKKRLLPRLAGHKAGVDALKRVTKAGKELGIPEYLVMRQPFPGPGLAIRIIGEVTEEMPGRVVVTTEIGAETLLPPPGGELLPRIC